LGLALIITFCVSRKRREMYYGHVRLSVCLSVCLSLSVHSGMPALLHGPGCNLGSGKECPLVVHYWVDLQSVHGLRCYGNITRTRNVSEYMLVLALCLGQEKSCILHRLRSDGLPPHMTSLTIALIWLKSVSSFLRGTGILTCRTGC